MFNCAIAIFLISCSLLIQMQGGQSRKDCAASISECPAEGCGEYAIDRELNKLKNRVTEPASFTPLSIEELVNLQKFEPESWTPDRKRSSLSKWEETGVTTQGYLLRVRQGPIESANCQLSGINNSNWVLSLVQRPNETREQSVTAQISPRHRPTGWDFNKLEALAKEDAYIRVSGWLLLNTAQLNQRNFGKLRATNWEIHPVVQIEVCKSTISECQKNSEGNNGWVKLADL